MQESLRIADLGRTQPAQAGFALAARLSARTWSYQALSWRGSEMHFCLELVWSDTTGHVAQVSLVLCSKMYVNPPGG